MPEAVLNHATEVPVTSASASDQPGCVRLGLADAARLTLRDSDAVLLTDDEPLFRTATAREAPALYLTHETFRCRFLV